MASGAGTVHGRKSDGAVVDMDFIRSFAFTGNATTTPSIAELKMLAAVLQDAKSLISNGRISELEALCCHIPGAITRSMLAAKDFPNRPLIQGVWYEVLFAVVTMAGAAFASPYAPSVMDRVMSMLFLALHNGLNSGCETYKERKQMGLRDREVVVPSIRLSTVLQVPGLLVRVNKSVKPPQSLCAVTGSVNTFGIACACCRIPAWADPILFSLTWLLVESGEGKGCELVLKMLSAMHQNLELPTVALLLHQLVSIESSFDKVIRLMKLSTSSPIIDELINKACTQVYLWLTAIQKSTYGITMIKENPHAFSVFVRHLHSISFCGVRDGIISGTKSVVLLLRNSQRRIWEQFVTARWFDAVTLMVAEAIELIPPSTSGEDTLVSHKWLAESKLISKLLFANKTMANTQQVLQLLTVLGKHKVRIEESDFLDLVTKQLQSVERPGNYPQTNETVTYNDLVTATMLELLDISAYSHSFLHAVLKWLALRKADSAIRGRRIFFILPKLIALDKQGTLQAGISALMAMNVANVADTEIATSFRIVTQHYKRLQECRLCRERENREENESMASARKKARVDAVGQVSGARKDDDDSEDDVKIVRVNRPFRAT